MKTKSLNPDNQRVFTLVLEPGDEIVSSILEFARREKISAGRLTAVGAVSDAVVAYFDRETKQYKKNAVKEQTEVAALTGTIAVQDGEAKLHAHGVLGRRDGSAIAGHFIEAHVWPTLEVVLVAYSDSLNRSKDPGTGLALLVP
jgi:uncharacterized protein